MPVPTFQNIGEKVTVEQLSDFIYGHIRRLNDFLAHLDTLNVDELNADVINAGTILAQLVTIMAGLSGGAYIRIDGDGMTVNDGSKDTFTVDLNGFVTLTGALFRSSTASYPRVDIDPSGTPILSVSQAFGNALDIISSYTGGSPAVVLRDGGVVRAILQKSTSTEVMLATIGNILQIVSASNLVLVANGGGNINLLADGDVHLAPSGNIRVNGTTGWSGTYSDGTNTITVVKGIITNVA